MGSRLTLIKESYGRSCYLYKNIPAIYGYKWMAYKYFLCLTGRIKHFQEAFPFTLRHLYH